MVVDKYIARLIRYGSTLMVNICDEELLGKTVEGNGLKMHISESYFSGDKVDLNEALDLIRKSNSSNLVGSRIVKNTLQANLASKLAVKKVGSTLFLIIFKFCS